MIVPAKELAQAINNWVKYSKEPLSFKNFLGIKVLGLHRMTDGNGYSFNDETAHRINQLAGPHALTIIKASEARNAEP